MKNSCSRHQGGCYCLFALTVSTENRFLQFSVFLYEENLFAMITIGTHRFEKCFRKKAHV